MANLNVDIPDELEARLQEFLAQRGEDAGRFVARAVAEQIIAEEDPEFHAAIVAKIKQGMAEADAGQLIDARTAMREIAAEKGINLPR